MIPKTVRTAIATMLLMVGGLLNAQGIPVIDSASIAKSALQHAESLAKYLEQINTLKAQLERAERQFEAMTGTRNLGNIHNDPSIRAALPADVRAALRGTGDGLESLESRIERIKRNERLTGDYKIDGPALEHRMEQLSLRSNALLEEVQSSTQARLRQLDLLQDQINQTEDPMAIAELQARLQVEQSNIQVDQIRADLLARQVEAEKMLIEEQAFKLAKQTSMSVDAIRAPLPASQ